MFLSAKQAWMLARIFQHHPDGATAREFCDLNRQHELSRVPSAMPRIYYDATLATLTGLARPVTRSAPAQNRPAMLLRRPGRPAVFELTAAGREWAEKARRGEVGRRDVEVPADA